jgi:hypothetical protein
MDDNVILDALKMFGLKWLSLLLKLFDDGRHDRGYARIEIVIREGKISYIALQKQYRQ